MDTCRIMNNKAKFGGYLIVGIDGSNVKDFEEEASMLLERARMLTSVDAEQGKNFKKWKTTKIVFLQ